jgi:hypothetical protein
MRNGPLIATVLVLVHLIIAYLHGEAHSRLGVDLAAWQWTYAYSVITIAPLIAMALYWTAWRKAAALLLAISMVGSFLFGVYHHFLAVSPDHVGHLPEGDAQGLFVSTAVLLAISEAATAAFAFWNLRRVRSRAG